MGGRGSSSISFRAQFGHFEIVGTAKSLGLAYGPRGQKYSPVKKPRSQKSGVLEENILSPSGGKTGAKQQPGDRAP